MAPNHIEKVAIIGATGHIGRHFAEELAKTGKHTVTAIMRSSSKNKLPDGVKAAQVDMDNLGSPETQAALTEALKGQQFLVITLPAALTRSNPEAHNIIAQAAGRAGVPYMMPNVYGGDVFNEALARDDIFSGASQLRIKEVKDAGAACVTMVCGFWYEWSLGLGEPFFGFDIAGRKVTFFDDGKTKISVSTWRQCGRALAALLSLPVEGSSPSLADWKDKGFYIDSWTLSQRDMLDSLHRVLGTADADWQITYEPSAKRRQEGLEGMQRGEVRGFVKAMYSRVFYPNGGGDFESTRGVANAVLGLPKEDLDASTRDTIALIESGWNPFAGVTL